MDALWSINERLGGKAGLDLEPFSANYMDDLIEQAQDEADAIRGTTRSYGGASPVDLIEKPE